MSGEDLGGPWEVDCELMWGMDAPMQLEEVGHLEASRWTEASIAVAIARLRLNFGEAAQKSRSPAPRQSDENRLRAGNYKDIIIVTQLAPFKIELLAMVLVTNPSNYASIVAV